MFLFSACAGDGFSIFWTDFGVVLSCGDNSKGCLGISNVSNLQHPKAIGKLILSIYFLIIYNRIFYTEPLDGVRITCVACGPSHVVALDSQNNIYSWGTCKSGALGLGPKKDFS